MPPVKPNTSDVLANGASDERSRAAVQRAKITDKRLEKAFAAGALGLTIFARRAPNAAAVVLTGLSGIDVRKPGLRKFTKFSYGWFAPQPIGIIPPGVYGLSPGYLHGIIDGIPESEYLHTIGPDHPAMIEFQRKKKLRATVQPAGPTITGAAGSEAATLVVSSGILQKLAGLQDTGRDVHKYFSRQLLGAVEEAGDRVFARSSELTEQADAPAPLPKPIQAPTIDTGRAARKRATLDFLGATTGSAARTTFAPEAHRARRAGHVDAVAPSLFALQRRKSEALKALAAGKVAATTVGR